MLVTLTDVLKLAEEKDYAVGSFNTPNLESIMAVVETAEKLDAPVIISHAQVHEAFMPIEKIGPVMLHFAKTATVPVCVHLDHGEDLEYVEKALKLGFTSVMYDGSLLPYEENVRRTIETVRMAKAYNSSVEAEIGILGGREAGGSGPAVSMEKMYTDPDMADRFVGETGIDALAASFGTAHGFYKAKPKLDFARIDKIKALVGIPLVMHGGSGVSPADYTTAISKGIRKINYYSYMARAGVHKVEELLKNQQVDFFHDISTAAIDGMKADIEKAMKVFYHLQTE
ncbi:class II fructose-bisphosphate aldolase [Paenibacillus sp. YN15]|uniref:class II fructose-bisphosphate aldolase n=1 Tax=Paenibacillus sp. YN15 TaxID=1742774 RepID=UPI000DCB990A|nr:class II fructose-bisphosphate aldolase [Paenibacillus sp. YN15]RAV06474.1 class II fructose-bisphosphate aldolase [Paenibacillus sp. YN15]